MTLPSPDLRFDIHPIRAKSVSWIELFYPCGHTGQILPNAPIRGVTYSGKRPIGFVWHNPRACTVTPQLLEWIYKEFQHIFTTNAFKWQVSSYTAPKELQCHLLGLMNN